MNVRALPRVVQLTILSAITHVVLISTVWCQVLDSLGEASEFVEPDTAPEVLNRVNPGYPPDAMTKALGGKVFVSVFVGIDGLVKKVKILKSDAEIFNQPALIDNKPFVASVVIPLRFRLSTHK